MAYSHTNSKGVTYYLNQGKGIGKGSKSINYFFTRDQRSDSACALPEGWEVGENPNNGFLFLRRKQD